jgi:hypothetical protein
MPEIQSQTRFLLSGSSSLPESGFWRLLRLPVLRGGRCLLRRPCTLWGKYVLGVLQAGKTHCVISEVPWSQVAVRSEMKNR